MTFFKDRKMFFLFWFIYLFIYMTVATYGAFISIFLKESGYSNTQIGLLLSISPIVALIGHPYWGNISDKAKYKNTVLIFLVAASSLCILLFLLFNNYYYFMFVIMIFTFFQATAPPILDVITLEHASKTKWHYGHIRLAGTIGFGIMAVIAGVFANGNIKSIFVIYSVLGFIACILMGFLPKIPGHRKAKSNSSMITLLKNKTLMIFIMFSFALGITMGFSLNFVGIYIVQLGGDTADIGIANLVSSFSEIPFLLFSFHVFKRFKIKHILVIVGFAATARWLFCGLADSPSIVIALQALHGLIFVPMTITLATYINKSVPDELKASGQALFALFTAAARIVSGFFGGFMSDLFGIKNTFIGMAVLMLAINIAWGLVFLKNKNEYAV